jgi:hypothetical protein
MSRGTLSKLDELNSHVSHVHDQMHKVIGAPLLISSASPVRSLAKIDRSIPIQDPAFQENAYFPEAERDRISMIKGAEDARVSHLAGSLPLGEALDWANRLLQEIADDHPEIVMYKELRAMSQVTGPAAQRLMGDVLGAYYEAMVNYDQQSTKLFQMGVAIAGWRMDLGSWRGTEQQQKFIPFGLESYEEGALDLTIIPRPLIPATEEEVLDVEIKRATLETERVLASAPPPSDEEEGADVIAQARGGGVGGLRPDSGTGEE